MNREEQQEIAVRVARGFQGQRLTVEEPITVSGQKRYVPVTNWQKLVAYLVRSGYRITLQAESRERPGISPL